MLIAGITASVIGAQRLSELWLAQRNACLAKACGGKEYGREHYCWLVALHVIWLISWLYEAILQDGQLSAWWPVWLGGIVVAQWLRYWCLLSLGPAWNTRIIVVPGRSRIVHGPYRWLQHPNYWAVAIELAFVPLLFQALATALVASLANAVLLLGVRIPAEEKALRELS